ncbi:MAG TPA: hypothetical protein VH186_21575 [Chloroflexia bacterium]|nr:hypothetical protein [Chloroflexia bacterium]
MARQKHRKEVKKDVKKKVKVKPSSAKKPTGNNRPRGKVLPSTYPPGIEAKRRLLQQLQQLQSYLENEKMEEALDISDEILEEHPNDLNALTFGAYAAQSLGDFTTSLKRARRSLELKPQQPLLLSISFTSNYNLGYNTHARQNLRELSNMKVDNSELFNQSHKELLDSLENNLLEQAEKAGMEPLQYEEALLAVEDSQLALLENEPEEAIELGLKAVSVAPELEVTLNSLVLLLTQAGRGAEAHEYAGRAYRLYPQSFQTVSTWMFLLGLARQREEALALRPALLETFQSQLMQRDEETQQTLYNLLARTLGVLQDDTTIYQVFKERVEKQPEQITIQDYRFLAAACWNLGKAEEARQAWERVTALSARSEDEEVEAPDAAENTRIETDLAIQAEIARPKPPEAAPYRVPYLDFNELIPSFARSRLIVFNDEDYNLDQAKMQAGYAELAPYYPVAEALISTMVLETAIFTESLAKVMLVIDAPELLAALKDFALGVYGPAANRAAAVRTLLSTGNLLEENQQTIRFWSEDSAAWEERTPESFQENSPESGKEA